MARDDESCLVVGFGNVSKFLAEGVICELMLGSSKLFGPAGDLLKAEGFHEATMDATYARDVVPGDVRVDLPIV